MNSLILRTANSPYNDITKGSVLSQIELDNNFINLKGGMVYSGSSNDSILTLNKINGESIDIDLKIKSLTFSGDYNTLSGLIDDNSLVIGNKYLLTDYKTIYQINGTNSTNRQEIHTMIGIAGLYTQFNYVSNNIASNGDIVTCVYAPPGATISSGQTFVIVDYYNSAYIRFSPAVSSTANIGSKFKFEKQRYPNVPPDSIILDVNNKPVMKPGGILNTEVHDDGPYMSMTGAENPSPKLESIILTAIDVNKFSYEAESLTYLGDKLLYDFTDTIINDENGNQIGTRNGNILKRTNLNETISVNTDWRVQRFRRYGLDTDNWNAFLLKKSLGSNSATTATTIYNVSGVNYCTATNQSLSSNHRYLMMEPYQKNVYQDFAKSVENPFLSGVTSLPPIKDGARLQVNSNSGSYSNDITLPFSGLTGTTFAKDFNIFPISNEHETSLVSYFVCENLYNSVFLPYSQMYGSTFNLYVDSKDSFITNSTFSSLPEIKNNGYIYGVRAVDKLSIVNSGYFVNNNVLGYYNMNNLGYVYNSTFGLGYVGTSENPYCNFSISSTSQITNTIFGGVKSVYSIIDNFSTNNVLFICKYFSYSTLTGVGYLTMFKNANSIFSSNVNLKTFANKIPTKSYYGYIYDFNLAVNDLDIHNLNTNKNLIYQNFDENNVSSLITISTVQ